jgi:hypothetical protein
VHVNDYGKTLFLISIPSCSHVLNHIISPSFYFGRAGAGHYVT